MTPWRVPTVCFKCLTKERNKKMNQHRIFSIGLSFFAVLGFSLYPRVAAADQCPGPVAQAILAQGFGEVAIPSASTIPDVLAPDCFLDAINKCNQDLNKKMNDFVKRCESRCRAAGCSYYINSNGGSLCAANGLAGIVSDPPPYGSVVCDARGGSSSICNCIH